MKSCNKRCQKYFFPLAMVLLLAALLLPATPAMAAPQISVNPNSGAVGTRITITGTVFDSYKGDSIFIFFGDEEITGSPLEVDDTGTFTVEFEVPGDTEPGWHTIEARSDIKSTSMLAESSFIVMETEIEIDTIEGPIGTPVTVSGQGFYAGSLLTVNYYNIIGEKVGTVSASPIGEFSYQFNIPFSTAGEHKITVLNIEGNSSDIEFEVTPTVTLNLTEAAPGELLKARGTGFGYQTQIEINFGNHKVAVASTDIFGNFEVDFNIPDVTPGSYYVRAIDIDGNSDRATFNAIGGVTVSQTGGSVGERLTLEGSGFNPGGEVNVDYDNLRVATNTADNNGEFSATFRVPPSNSGSHVITVSDGDTVKKLAFNVESQAPTAPALLLPVNSSETKALAQLDWQDVSDPSSPVTYGLQIAADGNFSSLVLAREGLENSEYKLAEGEQLSAVAEDTPYYWRANATDSAGNESEWSAPWTFYVRAPIVPALMLPASGERVDDLLLLDWEDATSLSPPVSYNLQVATDLNFMDILLDKELLTVSEYVLAEDEELPDVKEETPYYWRVKAIDSAGNESEWSPPQTFSIGSAFSLPGWATITLIVIGVIIVALLAFILGRRTAFKEPGY